MTKEEILSQFERFRDEIINDKHSNADNDSNDTESAEQPGMDIMPPDVAAANIDNVVPMAR